MTADSEQIPARIGGGAGLITRNRPTAINSLTADTAPTARAGDDQTVGMAAFTEKRPPNFIHR